MGHIHESANGKRFRAFVYGVPSRSFGSEADAKRWIRKVEGEKATGNFVAPTRMKVSELVERLGEGGGSGDS